MLLVKHRKTGELHLRADYDMERDYRVKEFEVINKVTVPRELRNTSYHHRELQYMKACQERMMLASQKEVDRRKEIIEFIDNLLDKEMKE